MSDLEEGHGELVDGCSIVRGWVGAGRDFVGVASAAAERTELASERTEHC